MKAVVYTEYGPPDVLQYQKVEKPSPNEDEILVKVHAAAANAQNWHLMRADPFLVRLMAGLLKPKNKILGGPWMSMTGSNKIGTYMTKPNQKDLISIKELVEAGEVIPIIDRCYPLNEVAEAISYLEEGHARGKVVITVAQN